MSSLVMYAVIAFAIFTAGATSGFKVESWRWSAAELKAVEVAERDRAAKEAQENQAAAQLEQVKEKERVVYQTITKTVDRIVEKPVYRNVCLDDDGLRAVNSALTGAAAPAQPDAALPAPHAP